MALVLSVRGRVDIERPGAKVRPLKHLELVRARDALIPLQGGRALLLDREGKTRSIRERLVLGEARTTAPASAVFRILLEKLMRMGQAQIAESAAERPRAMVPIPLAPSCRSLDGHPLFEWRPARDRVRYRLLVTRSAPERATQEEEAVVAVELVGTSWVPPGVTPGLEPGSYTYTVETLQEADEPPLPIYKRRSPPITFRVLGAETRAHIIAQRTVFEAGLPTEPWQRQILLASFYEQEGVFLLDDARRALIAAQTAAPDEPAVSALLTDLERVIEAASGVSSSRRDR